MLFNYIIIIKYMYTYIFLSQFFINSLACNVIRIQRQQQSTDKNGKYLCKCHSPLIVRNARKNMTNLDMYHQQQNKWYPQKCLHAYSHTKSSAPKGIQTPHNSSEEYRGLAPMFNNIVRSFRIAPP